MDDSSSSDHRSVAWEAAHRRFAGLVFSIPRRWGNTAADIEEIVQDTWLVAVRKFEMPPDDTTLKRFLVSTAFWNMRAAYRKSQVKREFPAEFDDYFSGDGELPDAVMVRLEREAAIMECVAALSRSYRTIIEQLFLQKPPPSYAEIAELLGISVQSVSPRRKRALDQLKKCLKGKGIHDWA